MSKSASKLSRCMKAPLRVLTRARDLYIRSLTGCAGRMHAVGYPPTMGEFPRSYSLHSSASDDELRELIRVLSQRRAAEGRVSGASMVMKRSQSVAVGRIDEEEPCEFTGDVVVGSSLLFPRSRSCAVAGGGRSLNVEIVKGSKVE